MASLQQTVTTWLNEAEGKSEQGALSTSQIDELRRLVNHTASRQRLLYLHTQAPSVKSKVVGMAQHEPVPDGTDTLRTRQEWPYNTVHDAIVDGWQVIQFPNLQSPYDDQEMSYVGFEFILQKLEEVVDE